MESIPLALLSAENLQSVAQSDCDAVEQVDGKVEVRLSTDVVDALTAICAARGVGVFGPDDRVFDAVLAEGQLTDSYTYSITPDPKAEARFLDPTFVFHVFDQGGEGVAVETLALRWHTIMEFESERFVFCVMPSNNAVASAEYANGRWDACPNCQYDDLDFIGRMEADGASAWQRASCKRCGLEWQEEYALVGYDVFDEASKNILNAA